MPEYFLILLFIAIATFFLQRYFKVKIFKSYKHLIIFYGVNLFLATIWDQFAISRGHWMFNPKYLLGINLGSMPLEEFLFVIVLGYFALTFFKILEKKKL